MCHQEISLLVACVTDLVDLQQDVASIDLDRSWRDPPHEKQTVLTTVGHHGDDLSRLQSDGYLALRVHRPADLYQLRHVLLRTELVEVFGDDFSRCNPRLAERLTVDGVAEQTGSVRSLDRADLNLSWASEQEEKVGLTTKDFRISDRANLVCLALHKYI